MTPTFTLMFPTAELVWDPFSFPSIIIFAVSELLPVGPAQLAAIATAVNGVGALKSVSNDHGSSPSVNSIPNGNNAGTRSSDFIADVKLSLKSIISVVVVIVAVRIASGQC